MDADTLRERWSRTLPPNADWTTLSPEATYRADAPTVVPARHGFELRQVGQSGFDLLGEVGRGGMGVVYRGRQVSLDREVAIKCLLPTPGFEDGASETRFVAEGLVTAHLEHPNIVPVHELGRMPEGAAFLAMKLVGGRSWRDLLYPDAAEEKEDTAFHLDVFLSVCNAVDFAHSRDVVHLDLKPHNVMVGEFGEVLLMDWGLAASLGQGSETSTRAPRCAGIAAPLGTPAYMAPELAAGEGERIGPWTDVYLLGAILYEVLEGHPPHRGQDLMAVLLSASEGPPPLRSPAAGPELRAICRRAMAPEPEDRYPDVRSLRKALRTHLRHRESDAILVHAEESVAAARSAASEARKGSPGATGKRLVYERFAEAIASYRQAQALWKESGPARAGERQARLAYADVALELGDLGLAEAQAQAVREGSEGTEEHAATVSLLDRIGQATRRLSRRRNRMRTLVAVLAAILVCGSAWLTYWYTQPAHHAIRTSLPRANVYVDGQLTPRTGPTGEPVAVTLSSGTHTIRITSDGFIPKERRLRVAWGEVFEKSDPIVLAPGFETWTLLTSPLGAQITLSRTDGDFDLGSQETPWSGKLPSGTYTLGFELNGYIDWQAGESITVEGRTEPKLRHHRLQHILRWSAPTDGSIAAAATIADVDGDGRPEVIVGARGKVLYCLAGDLDARESPSEIWKLDLQADVWTTPLAFDADGDGRDEVIFKDNDLLFIETVPSQDGLTARIRTRVELGGYTAGSPLLLDLEGDGTPEVLTGAGGGRILCLDLQGNQIWEHALGSPIVESPTAGDLDQDGRPELIVATHAGSVACIEPPREAGAARTRWTYNTGAKLTSSPAIADLDGDGRAEVIVGAGSLDREEGHVLCLQSVEGEVAARWTWPAGAAVRSTPAVIDLDGDTRPEVIFLSPGDSTICLAQDGVAVRRKWRFPHLAGNSSPAVADLDGDGALEVVFGSTDKRIYALGADGLPHWSYWTRGEIQASPALLDLDGNGFPEVVAGSWNGTLHCLALSREQTFLTGGGIVGSPVVVDLDADGRLEIVVGSADTAVYAFDLDGRAPVTFSTGGEFRATPVTVDLIGDARPEVLVGDRGGHLHCLRGTHGKPMHWESHWEQPFEAEGSIGNAVALGDLDADDQLDILVGSWAGKLYRLNVQGKPIGAPFDTAGALRDTPVLVDLDGDDRPEVLVVGCEDQLDDRGKLRREGRLSPGTLHCLRVHDGEFDEVWRFTASGPISAPAVVTDERGARTVLVASWDGTLTALDANGATRAELQTGVALASPPLVIDLDRDGRPEVLVATRGLGVLCLRLPDQDNAAFETPWTFAAGAADVWASPRTLDLDGDGRLEVLVCSVSGFLAILEPPRDSEPPTVVWSRQLDRGSVTGAPVVADVDADGRPEIVVGNWNRKVYVLKPNLRTAPSWSFATRSR